MAQVKPVAAPTITEAPNPRPGLAERTLAQLRDLMHADLAPDEYADALNILNAAFIAAPCIELYSCRPWELTGGAGPRFFAETAEGTQIPDAFPLTLPPVGTIFEYQGLKYIVLSHAG